MVQKVNHLANSRPLLGESYLEYDELKSIVHSYNLWQFEAAENQLNALREKQSIEHVSNELVDMLECEVLIATFELTKAFDKLNEFIEHYPKNKQALFLLTALSMQLKDTKKYDLYLKQLTELSPSLGLKCKNIIHFVNNNIGRTDFEDEMDSLDTILLYGHRLEDDSTMSEELKRRLGKTKELMEKFPKSKLLVSGGAVTTSLTEAEVIYDWLIDHEIESNRIYLDDNARDTVGNIQGFIELIKSHNLSGVNYCCVTSMSHLARAWMSFVVAMEHEGIAFNRIYASAPSEVDAIVPESEYFFSLFTVLRSAGWLDRKQYTSFD